MTNIYQTCAIRYLEADQETRNASKKYWREIHAENIKTERFDLCMWSAKHLCAIEMADMFLETGDRSGIDALLAGCSEKIK